MLTLNYILCKSKPSPLPLSYSSAQTSWHFLSVIQFNVFVVCLLYKMLRVKEKNWVQCIGEIYFGIDNSDMTLLEHTKMDIKIYGFFFLGIGLWWLHKDMTGWLCVCSTYCNNPIRNGQTLSNWDGNVWNCTWCNTRQFNRGTWSQHICQEAAFWVSFSTSVDFLHMPVSQSSHDKKKKLSVCTFNLYKEHLSPHTACVFWRGGGTANHINTKNIWSVVSIIIRK